MKKYSLVKVELDYQTKPKKFNKNPSIFHKNYKKIIINVFLKNKKIIINYKKTNKY